MEYLLSERLERSSCSKAETGHQGILFSCKCGRSWENGSEEVKGVHHQAFPLHNYAFPPGLVLDQLTTERKMIHVFVSLGSVEGDYAVVKGTRGKRHSTLTSRAFPAVPDFGGCAMKCKTKAHLSCCYRSKLCRGETWSPLFVLALHISSSRREEKWKNNDYFTLHEVSLWTKWRETRRGKTINSLLPSTHFLLAKIYISW